jgi:hypothetical protein
MARGRLGFALAVGALLSVAVGAYLGSRGRDSGSSSRSEPLAQPDPESAKSREALAPATTPGAAAFSDAPPLPGGSPAPSVAGSSSASMPERLSRARERWTSIAEGVRRLDSTDQPGLDRLYAQARDAIRADEEAWLQTVAGSMSAIVGSSFEESFFAVSSWIRSSQSPARILDAIWQYEPPADPPSTDAHHQAMTQSVRYERVQAYGVRELRQQVDQRRVELPTAESDRLIASLLPRAARERSLNLTIEVVQLLSALRAPEEAIQRALQARPAKERELLQGVLKAR